MVDLLTAVRLVAGTALLLSNGYFVTTEFAMTRIRQFPEEEFREPGLERAWAMTDRLEIYLSGCQVGITISSVGLGVVAEPAVAAVLDSVAVSLGLAAPLEGGGHTAASVVVAFGLINLLHVVVGEQAPTYLGIERTRLVARYGAEPLYWWTTLMWPVIVVADRIAKLLLGLVGVEITRSWTDEGTGELPSSRGELKRQMGEELRHAGVSDERRDEVLNALEIGSVPVEEVMVDRDDVVALSTTADLETTVERIRESPHVRYPLVGDDLDAFEGVVYSPGIAGVLDRTDGDGLDLTALAAPPMTVDAATPVSEVIDRFQAENQELALVERDGEVVGLVTVTDCFEAIAGDLEDPLDKQLLRGR